jgi:hypothetical protein
MYKLVKSSFTGNVESVLNLENHLHIPFNPDNTDYQQYLKWVEEGNTPLPADSQPTGENNEGVA